MRLFLECVPRIFDVRSQILAKSPKQERTVDLSYSKEEAAFREEVRDFFRTSISRETRRKLIEGRPLSKDDIVSWQRILNKKGWF